MGKGAEEVPTKVISQLVSDNPRSRIIIVTTVRPLKVNIKVL